MDSSEGEQEQDHDAVMSLVSHYHIILQINFITLPVLSDCQPFEGRVPLVC